MKLEKLSRKVADSFGLGHQMELGVLRHYIRTTSNIRLTTEIGNIKDAALLRILWEAGLSSELQDVVLERLKKVS
ncbi:unnamed protein product [marine sediment metagenome]|uniref:Uncharacterized protein n=1 Tax=marine sediment metagenome TaxID=412755 RepID=X1W351_9ZZZZ